MEADTITCSFCDQPASGECKRCSRAHCSEHGAELCATCRDPRLALPSGGLFRLAAVSFVACILLGLWFLIGTPRLPGEGARAAGPPLRGTSNRPQMVATATLAGSSLVTPAASSTPVPASRDYMVKAGDTIDSIATASGVTSAAILRLNPDVDPTALKIGQILRIPVSR